MNAPIDIREIGPATAAALEAVNARVFVPPCVDLSPELFYAFNVRPDGETPKVRVIVSHDDARDVPKMWRDPIITRVRLERHPDFPAGGSYDARIAEAVFRQMCRSATDRQISAFTIALAGIGERTSVGEYAKLCRTAMHKDRHDTATGPGVLLLTEGLGLETYRTLTKGAGDEGRKSVSRRMSGWLKSIPSVRNNEAPVEGQSVLTVASAFGVLAAGAVRASVKTKRAPAIAGLKAAALAFGIELLFQ